MATRSDLTEDLLEGSSDLTEDLLEGSDETFDTCCASCLEDGKPREAEKYCVNCAMNYCGLCLQLHYKFSATRGHEIVDVSAPEAKTALKTQPTERCEVHKGKIKDMYCDDHENICCSACIAIKHRTCKKIEYLPNVVQGIKASAEYRKVKDDFSQLISQLNEAKATRTEELTMLDGENEALMAKINRMEEELKERVGLLAQHTRDKLKSKYTQGKSATNDSIQSIQSVIDRLIEKEAHLEDDNEVRVFESVKEGKAVVNETRSLVKETSGHVIQRLAFVPNSDIQDMLKNTKLLGTVDLTKRKETARKDVKGYTASLAGRYKVGYKQCTVTAGCCLDEDTLLVSDNKKRLLRLNMDDFKVIEQLKMECVSYSVCPTGPQEVAVALWIQKKVQFVSVGKSMKQDRLFSVDHFCRGMMYNEHSGELFVNDGYNQIKVYDKTGNFLRNFCSDSSPFTSLENMALNGDIETIYIADRKKGLLALSMSGETQWIFIDPDLRKAQGICVLTPDIILVSGSASNNVLQIDRHGKKLGVLLWAGDQLNRPYSLVYDRKRSKLIVGHESENLHVYNISAI